MGINSMPQYLFRVNSEHALWEFLPHDKVLKTRQCLLGRAFWVSEKILLAAVIQLLSTTSGSPQHLVFHCHSSMWVWNSLSSTAVLGFISELPMGLCSSLSTKHFVTGMRGCPLLSSCQYLLGLTWYAVVGVQFFKTSLQAGKNKSDSVNDCKMQLFFSDY